MICRIVESAKVIIEPWISYVASFVPKIVLLAIRALYHQCPMSTVSAYDSKYWGNKSLATVILYEDFTRKVENVFKQAVPHSAAQQPCQFGFLIFSHFKNNIDISSRFVILFSCDKIRIALRRSLYDYNPSQDWKIERMGAKVCGTVIISEARRVANAFRGQQQEMREVLENADKLSQIFGGNLNERPIIFTPHDPNTYRSVSPDTFDYKFSREMGILNAARLSF